MIAGGIISVWQAALITSLLLAVIIGRPPWSVAVVMLGNLAGSYLLARYADPFFHYVMVLDVLSASILMGRGARANFVALLFALMVPLYIPAIVLLWPFSTTQAIVEVLAYTQIAIVGGVGGGYVHRYFGDTYGRGDSLRSMAIRRHAAKTYGKGNGAQGLKKRGRNLD